MTAEAVFASIFGTLIGTAAIGVAIAEKWRNDQYERESRRRFEDEMYARGMIPTPPGMDGPAAYIPYQQMQLPMNQPFEVRWVGINMDAAAQSNYNAMYRDSMYTNSREVTFSKGDELIRNIGLRPPSSSPIYGHNRPY